MDIKRLKELAAKENPEMQDVIEIASENILSSSKHNKDIKALLEEILHRVEDLSVRLEELESKKASIFQIEINEEVNEEDNASLTLEEEVELVDLDDLD